MDNIINTLKQSKSFCILPWVHLMFEPSGITRPCCIAKELRDVSGSPVSIGNDPGKAWNSESVRKIRRDMLSGKRIGNCSECYFLEDMGRESKRMIWNTTYLDDLSKRDSLILSIERSARSGFCVDKWPEYLDLRFGNRCNLSCRMCNPTNSSALDDEWSTIMKVDKAFESITPRSKIESDWYNDEMTLKSLASFIPGLRTLYLTGGEPMLIRQNLDFIIECIKSGHAGKIDLIFNTNCTHLNNKIISCLGKFKSVKLNLSLDGSGKINDYIRYPSNWSKIEENIDRLMEMKDISLVLTPTIQLLNADCFTELLLWFEGKAERKGVDTGIYCNLLYTPRFYSISIAPMKIKLRALAKIKKYKDTSKYYNLPVNSSFRDNIGAIEGLLKNGKEDDKLLGAFKVFNGALDSHRKTELKDIKPELYASIYC